MSVSLSLYKDSLFKFIDEPSEITKHSPYEIYDIPQKIKQLHQEAIEKSTGLEGIKATKDALLSSLYYSYIALHCLNPDPVEKQRIQTHVLEMVAAYGGDKTDFEKQYDDQVSKYNASYFEAQKKQQELTDKDKKQLKYCVILADVLQIPLSPKEISGEGPLPVRFSTIRDAIAYNQAALTIHRQAELKRVEQYKNLLDSTFVADAELIKTSPKVKEIVKDYELMMKRDYPMLNEKDLEHLQMEARHYARNIGLNLKNDTYPIIGLEDVKFDSLKANKPFYELKYLFILNALKYDLMTTIINISYHKKDVAIVEHEYSIIENIETIGTRLALYFEASPSIEAWENALATGLCVNQQYQYLKLNHAQKTGEAPWILEITDKNELRIAPFYKNYLTETKSDIKEISTYLKLKEEVANTKNGNHLKELKEKIGRSERTLMARFDTNDPAELQHIHNDSVSNIATLQFIIEGIDPVTHTKSTSNLKSGKWWSFSHRGIKGISL